MGMTKATTQPGASIPKNPCSLDVCQKLKSECRPVFGPSGHECLARVAWFSVYKSEALKGRPLTRRRGATPGMPWPSWHEQATARRMLRASHVTTPSQGKPEASSPGPSGQRPTLLFRRFAIATDLPAKLAGLRQICSERRGVLWRRSVQCPRPANLLCRKAGS
jgi:hypothetical protein